MQHAIDLVFVKVSHIVDSFILALPNLLAGCLVLSVFIIISNWIKPFVTDLSGRTKLDLTLSHALGTLAGLLVQLLGLLVFAVIVVPSFSLANLIAGLGISSVAIGFAFKDILQNFLAGLLLLWQKPFKIGDQIKTRDFEGTVDDISIRSTYLRMFTGELVLIPNGDIFSNAIIVNTAFGKRQLKMSASVKDCSDIDRARTVIKEALASISEVVKDPAPQVYLSDAASENMTFTIYFWTSARQEEALDVTDKVATKLRQRLSELSASGAKASERASVSPVIDAKQNLKPAS